MSKQEINNYIKYLKSEKSKENYYTKQTVKHINKRINEANQILKNNSFLTEKDLAVEIMDKPVIDRYRDIFLSFIRSSSDFGNLIRPIRIHLTKEIEGDYYIICQRGYFNFMVPDDKTFEAENFESEWIIKISSVIFKRIEEYLENTKLPVLTDQGLSLDGETRLMRIGGSIIGHCIFSWTSCNEQTEPLHRLSQFLIDLADENYSKRLKDKNSKFDKNILDLINEYVNNLSSLEINNKSTEKNP